MVLVIKYEIFQRETYKNYFIKKKLKLIVLIVTIAFALLRQHHKSTFH